MVVAAAVAVVAGVDAAAIAASTMSDYPAAHSMDTTWFAVDANGRIAQFDSGENGAVPKQAASGGGAAEPSFDTELLESVCTETKRPIAFEHGDDDPGLYTRSELPDQPLLVDDLPQAIRDHVKELALPVDFAAQDTIHLADHMRDDEAYVWAESGTLRYSEQDHQAPPPVARVVTKPSRISIAVAVAIVAAIIGLILR